MSTGQCQLVNVGRHVVKEAEALWRSFEARGGVRAAAAAPAAAAPAADAAECECDRHCRESPILRTGGSESPHRSAARTAAAGRGAPIARTAHWPRCSAWSRALGHALSVTRTRSRALGHALSVTRSRSRALGHVHSVMRSRSRALGHALSVSVRARRRVCAAGNRLGSARLLRDDSES